MMNIEIRAKDKAVISGYVNAVERESRVLHRVGGLPFREIVRQGTFKKALETGKPVSLISDQEYRSLPVVRGIVADAPRKVRRVDPDAFF